MSLFNLPSGDTDSLIILDELKKHLKKCFLVYLDKTPKTLDQLLVETGSIVSKETLNWLRDVGLPSAERVEITEEGKSYSYRPPLPCRDATSLWELLVQYERDGPLGMLREDVADSIPGTGVADAAIESFKEKLDIIVRGDKKEVLFLRDETFMDNPSAETISLWHSVDVSKINFSTKKESRKRKK